MSVRGRIGTPGYLVPIPGVTALSDALSRAESSRTTLSGRKVAQVSRRAHRTWDVTVRPGASSADLANIVAFAEGEWGPGPFVFLSEWAQVTNLLTPRASLLDMVNMGVGWSNGGPVVLEGGDVAGRHLFRNGGSSSLILPRAGAAEERVPVLPGVPVTASIYGTGLLTLALRWLTAAGALIAEQTPVTASHGQIARRLHTTGTPPAGAAFAQLRVQTELNKLVARPAVTWTPDLMPYYPGSGASSVRVTGLSQEVSAAWISRGGQRAGLSFTVEEVG